MKTNERPRNVKKGQTRENAARRNSKRTAKKLVLDKILFTNVPLLFARMYPRCACALLEWLLPMWV